MAPVVAIDITELEMQVNNETGTRTKPRDERTMLGIVSTESGLHKVRNRPRTARQTRLHSYFKTRTVTRCARVGTLS